jgi:hypothetical protein
MRQSMSELLLRRQAEQEIERLQAELDRVNLVAQKYSDKLHEWQELTGCSCPSVCANELAILRLAVAASAVGLVPMPRDGRWQACLAPEMIGSPFPLADTPAEALGKAAEARGLKP